MSWFSENYEKAFLGGAAVITVTLGYMTFKSGDDPFSIDLGKQNNDTSVPGLVPINKTKKSLAVSHEILQRDVDGRKVDLFTGVALFAKADDPKNPVDLLKSSPVHQGIPNTWWLKYELDPGFNNAPDLDPDEDGFTNREEFVAETNPIDFDKHPNPVTKLRMVERKTTQVHIKPQDFGNNKFLFKLENKRERRLNQMDPKPIGFNTIIPFVLPLMKDRFKFLSVMEKPNTRTGMKDKIWLFEDQKPNKKGDVYKFDSRGRLEGLSNRSSGIMDTTITLRLEALKQGGNNFEIEEGTNFSLPYKADAKIKPYFLKKVDLKSKLVEVVYTDENGQSNTHTMEFK
ncbi:MAG TPA: hypothetical protein DEP88_05330 [Verrucomicrobiales bacterium]|jgi:hypothetical protein|nr:hypothetical protein [Verrucomicrobiales bacterium]HCI90988.1 hypothetical protein [Verrucomicrobiales bacterium]